MNKFIQKFIYTNQVYLNSVKSNLFQISSFILFLSTFHLNLLAKTNHEEIVNRNGHDQHSQLETYQLKPTKMLQKSVQVFSPDHPAQVLNQKEGKAPAQINRNFLSFAYFTHNAILSEEVKHGQKRTSMHPEAHYLPKDCPFFSFLDDSFWKSNPQTPETENDNKLKSQSHQMKSGEEQLRFELRFLLRQNNGKNEVDNHKTLAYDGKVEEIENSFTVHVNMNGKHGNVQGQKKPKLHHFSEQQRYIKDGLKKMKFTIFYVLFICIYFNENIIFVFINFLKVHEQNYSYIDMSGFSQIPSDTIRKHQTNRSTSKNAYPFSKSQRFPKPNPQCKNAFYSYDSQLSNRKASIGSGRKYDFTRDLTCSPGATKYNLKSWVEENKSKGKSFGLNRESLPDRSYLVPQMQKVPGPGNYENQAKTRMTISFTMRPKTTDFISERMTYKKDPGPGEYNEVNMEPKAGRFVISKYSDSKYAKINDNTPRFQKQKEFPGPSTYAEGDNMNKNGKYVLSHRRGYGTRTFDKEKRELFKIKKGIPGPGQHNLPSEFGVYGQFDDEKMKATIG